MGLFELVSENGVIRLFTAVLVGALLGLMLSFVINCILVEVSLNPLLGFYFGVLFEIVGGVILCRVNGQQEWGRKIMLIAFALLVMLSGVLCFVFDEKWIFTLSPGVKIPLYGLIGISSCFAITFSVVDLLNLCLGQCSPEHPPLIESARQVNLVLVTSIVMGLGYGFFFGALDVGKSAHTASQLSHQLIHEEMFCIPFGIIVGAIAAATNEYFRRQQMKSAEYKYSPLFSEDVDDMI